MIAMKNLEFMPIRVWLRVVVRERAADSKGAVTCGRGLLQFCQQLLVDIEGVVG